MYLLADTDTTASGYCPGGHFFGGEGGGQYPPLKVSAVTPGYTLFSRAKTRNKTAGTGGTTK